jgi:hypothetical protein
MEITRLNHDETIVKIGSTLDRLEGSLRVIAEDAERGVHTGDEGRIESGLRHLEDEVKRYYAENRCFREAERYVDLLERISELRNEVQ